MSANRSGSERLTSPGVRPFPSGRIGRYRPAREYGFDSVKIVPLMLRNGIGLIAKGKPQFRKLHGIETVLKCDAPFYTHESASVPERHAIIFFSY
jgi:hypothetical protein